MSFDRLERWQPRIDENGILHPTNDEQGQMLTAAIRQIMIIRIIVGAMIVAAISLAIRSF